MTEVTLAQAITTLRAALSKAEATIALIDTNDLNTLLKAFKTLSDRKKEISDIESDITSLHKKMSTEILPGAFEALGFDSVKAGGYNFILSARLYASMSADKQELGFQWLRDNGLESIIVPTVNAKTLTSVVKAFIEEKGETPPETAMSIHTEKYVQVRKS